MKTTLRPLFRLLAMAALLLPMAGHAQDISASAREQIEALIAEKESRSPAQQKMDSQLVYLSAQEQGEPIAEGVPTLEVSVQKDADNRVLVDISGTVSENLLDAIVQSGGEVVNQFAPFDAIRAKVPVSSLEALAARADVRSIKPAALATTNAGIFLSQGDRTHRADTARTNLAATGSGIKIGVLSDGVNSLGISKSSGELNASATFLPGQAGAGDEGTAMMEIIQDLVPDAQIIFATAFNGDASMAANILALHAAGCSIIVDDVSYFNESPFQDGVISQAVNTVSAAGVMFFSSARNSGNKNDNTSGTWEGDFVSGGAVAAPVTGSGTLLDFDSGAGTTTFNTVAAGGSSRRVDLFWADPMAGSANDYDMFVLNSAGTAVLRGSTNIQNGTQDPYEATGTLNVGERIVVVQRAGAANRFIHLDTGRAILTLSTEGNVRGHNASGATHAFSVAATNVANSPNPNFFVGGATNPVETFSSDGPRRMFFTPNGTPITAGNFSSTGGAVLNKPDITAADGVATAIGGGFNPFFGTSAAAPHAAAIAALLKSYNAALTPAQIRTALTSTALDIEAAGNDRDSGAGIIMALEALQSVAVPNSVISGTPLLASSGLVGGPFNPSSATYTIKNSSASPLNWTATKTQSWTTLSSPGGTLAAGASTAVICSVNAGANALALGSYSDAVTITDTTSGLTRNFSVSLNVVPEPPAQVADVTSNAGTSAAIVVGNSTYHVSESIYLDSELGTSQFLSADTAINQIAFSCSQVGTAPTVASPHFKLYLKNVSSGTTTFAAGAYDTAGYTLVYSGAYTYPTTGFWGVTLNTPFVRTAGSNVQVLIERTDNATHASNIFNASVGNLLSTTALSSRRYNSTAAPVSGTTSLATTTFRPAIRFRHAPANDATASVVYSLGELPLGLSPTQSIQALVTNTGAGTQTNLPVTLNITGANTFTNTQVIPSLASGAQTLVTFGAFTPGATGSCTVTVSVPADGDTSNNSLSKPLNVTPLSYSYKYPGSASGGGVGVTGGTGTLVSKFTTTSANAVTQVTLEFPSVTASAYRVAIYPDSGSNTPSTAPLYVDAADRTVSAAGPVTITLPSPVAVGAGNFYVGLQQTNTTNVGAGFEYESPLRTGTFFFGAVPPTSWADMATNTFKLNMGVVLQTPAVPPEIVVYDGSGTGGAQRTDNTGTATFGSVNVGSSSAAQTFTIQNQGTSTVNLTDLVISGTNPAEFSVTQPAQTILAANATTTFTVTFSPNGAGARSGVVNIASNDGDENPFEINVGGTGIGIPEIAVFDGVGTGGSQRTDNTGTHSFGSVNVGSSSAAQTFTIQNTGSGDLTGIAVTSSSAEFVVDTTGMSSSLVPNATTSFTVTFSVAAGSAAGARSAVVNIASNDSDENPFEINTSGTAVAVPGAITQLGTLGTSFGVNDNTLENYTVPAGANRALIVTASHAFENDITAVTFDGQPLTQVVEIGGGSVDGIWVRAMGTSGSSTTGNIVVTRTDMDSDEQVITAAVYENVDQVTPMNSPQFFSDSGTQVGSSLMVTSEPGDIVFDLISIYASTPPSTGTPGAGQARRHGPFTGNTATWSTSTKAGAASVTMSWTTTGDYIQHVAANINMAVNAEIAVYNGNGTGGTERADNTGTFGFGNLGVGLTGPAQTFTIQNQGGANLTGILPSSTNPAEFIVDTSGMTSSLAPNATTTFTVAFKPSAGGTRTGVINIASSDADENPFEIQVNGVGLVPPTVSVVYGAPSIAQGAITTLTYTLTNPNAVPLSGVAFTDGLPLGLVVGYPNGLVHTTGGTVTAVSGSREISLTGGTLTAGGSATLTVNVMGVTTGVKNDMYTVVTSTEAPAITTGGQIPAFGISTRLFGRRIMTGNVGAGDPTQTGRMNRFAVVSVVGVNKPYPGNFTTVGARRYETQTIANPTAVPQDVQLWLNTGTTDGFVAAYLNSFNPTNLGQNYLADPGSSFPGLGTFGFTIPAGQTAVIVIHEVNPGSNAFDYSLGVNTPVPATFAAVGALPTITVTPAPDIAAFEGSGTGGPERIDNLGTFSFGNVAVGGNVVQTFTIQNTGALNLTSLSVSSTSPAEFAVTQPPLTTLTEFATTTFTVTYTPPALGASAGAVISIASNDAQENPFEIGVTGTGISTGPLVFTGVPITVQSGDYVATGQDLPTREMDFTPTPGTGYTYIEVTNPANDLIGAFNDLPQGGVVAMNLNGVIYYFQANYNGGPDGNDLVLTNFTPGPAMWKWLAGPSSRNGVGIYGTLNTPAPTNNPGARQGAMNWLGQDGSLWMFGGYGYATSVTNPPRYQNDLWQYDRTLGRWIWRKGNNTPNNFGVYGTIGVEAAANNPGSRHTGTTWTDANGNLWLFGGFGVGTGVGAASLNDLWRFNRTTGQWTWMKGSTVTGAPAVYGTLGVAAAANTPGARSSATGVYRDGFLWLLGGYTGTAYYSDLWRYEIATGNWAWMSGSNLPNQNGAYGTQGTGASENNPGARRDATGWLAKDGTLWFFGGLGLPATGATAGDLSDLWRYDPVTGAWTWMKGVNSTGAAGVYGTLNTPAPGNLPGARSAGSGWTTIDGDFWLVGGFKDSFLSFNDVWIYDVATNQWTWKQGAAGTLSVPGVYGTKGVAAPTNQPGGRFTPSTWVTLNGSLWIFGGGGADSFGNTGRLSDLWNYGIQSPSGTPYEDAMPADFPDALIVNADPSVTDATAGTMAYVPVSGQLTGTDTDGDRILFNAAGSTTSSQGTLTLNANGTWTYTPAFGFTGVASFQFKANDDYGGQSGVRTLVISVAVNPADSDGDGIADAYEQSIWGSLAAADGDGDADLDGQSNYFEFLAGTNPLNGNETLATAPTVTGVTGRDGGVQLQLNHVRPGVNYHLETSTDLDVWSRIGTFTFDVSGSATVEDPTPPTDAPKFYRMSLEATSAVIVP